MTTKFQTFDKRIPVDVLDRGFTRFINIGNDDRVRIIETGAEIFEQIAQAGIAVRLHHSDDVTLRCLAGSFQDCADLNRMMSVIINHGHPVPVAGAGKPPFHTLETQKRLADDLFRQSHLAGNRNGRE